MLIYFKDDEGVLRVVAGNIDLNDQDSAKRWIYTATGIKVKSAVLGLVVDNPPQEGQPVIA